MQADIKYSELLKHVLDTGNIQNDRTGTGTISVFGAQTRFDLAKEFPLLTTKKLHLKSIIHELLWFISGNTNIKYLKYNAVKIWDDWANKDGELGPVYGSQWRSWNTTDGKKVDQLINVIDQIKNNPDSRRHIVCAWNPGEINKMALPPCHALFQFYVHDGKLSCQLYQRSADIFLGVPFNIASYALLTEMIAQVCGLKAHEFIHTFGDLHIYKNHIEQVEKQMTRIPLKGPKLKLNPKIKDIRDFKFEDIEIINYKAHPTIKAPIAV